MSARPALYRLIFLADGPEKAGKSTLLRQLGENLEGHGVRVDRRKWSGPAKPDESQYLVDAMNWLGSGDSGQVCLWDRGWPSEYVYGRLLGQPRPMAASPLAPHWETALRPHLLPVIVLGPSAKASRSRRTADDLKVRPEDERQLYALYGAFNCWTVMANSWDPREFARDMRDITQAVLESLELRRPYLALSRRGAVWQPS